MRKTAGCQWFINTSHPVILNVIRQHFSSDSTVNAEHFKLLQFGAVWLAIFASVLDALSTHYFLSRSLGIELNPTLATLASQSHIWIFAYLVAPKTLLYLMREPLRFAFATYFTFLHLALALNNLIGICGGGYFLDTIGINAVVGFASLIGCIVFAIQLARPYSRTKQPRVESLFIAIFWVFVFCGAQSVFHAIATCFEM